MPEQARGTGALELVALDAAGPRKEGRVLVLVGGVPVGTVRLPGDRASGPDAPDALAALARSAWTRVVAERLNASPQPAAAAELSVVVCTRNRPERLQGCLAALRRQTRPPLEVIVVDNAPVDERVRALAGRFGCRYVAEPRPGLDWARNRGWLAAAGEVVAFTDDDARPDPRWVEAVGEAFGSPDVWAVTGLVLAASVGTEAQRLFEEGYGGMGKGCAPQVYSCRNAETSYAPSRLGAGCNMAFRRERLAELGGFDPALDVGTATGGGGDLDMLQRVLEAGGAVLYEPSALVLHEHRETRRQLRRQLFDNGRGYSAVLWAAFRRARGRERLRVLAAYPALVRWWHARLVVRRLRGRSAFPIHLTLVELAGLPFGPALYARARRRARRLAKEAR